MFDMMNMMGKVKELQEKMKEAQESLGAIEAEGESGAGLVKAVANGKKQVIKIDIDESLLNSADKTVIQDLVVAAVNIATQKAGELGAEHIKKQTEGTLPNIPGMDFSKLFNG
ncbi:YbaB/EbfC family nucleoid-associated protein [Reichenbachiella versicolor]|uniref:YbaB/EbfC family nucleoid-associated protein n=1 Tax=Reichenbachiella versicolor TaxID=1821036 RepID=UPI000D6E5D31|nr:YbaB/EbfC family nucleoid-associated protein [Reichenbachiella versicolor]